MHPIRAVNRVTGATGRAAIAWASHMLDLFALAGRLLAMVVWRPPAGRAVVHRIVVEQIYFTAVQALPIVIPVALVFGTGIILQFSKVAGVYDLGKVTVLLLVREIGPGVTALIVLLRSGVAVTAEVSYTRILNEVEALEMGGIDPMRVLGYPRLVGITVAVLSLFVVFDLTAIFGGNAVAWTLTSVPMENLLDQMGAAVSPADIAVGTLKALFFGITITVLALHHGFTVPKQMTAIPVACSKAAVETALYLLVLNILISVVFYL